MGFRHGQPLNVSHSEIPAESPKSDQYSMHMRTDVGITVGDHPDVTIEWTITVNYIRTKKEASAKSNSYRNVETECIW